MPREEDLHKKTLNLRRGDFEKIHEMFPKLGASKAIRRMVSNFVDSKYTTRSTATSVVDIPDLEL